MIKLTKKMKINIAKEYLICLPPLLLEVKHIKKKPKK
jgi:hypothetical protein